MYTCTCTYIYVHLFMHACTYSKRETKRSLVYDLHKSYESVSHSDTLVIIPTLVRCFSSSIPSFV